MAERKLTKHIKAILYQKRMVQQADAILVSSEHEKKDILRLGWTERIDVVADCVLDRQQSDDAMAHQAVDFYRKVLDTRYQLAMTAWRKMPYRACCMPDWHRKRHTIFCPVNSC